MAKTFLQKNMQALKVQRIKNLVAEGKTSEEAGREVGMTGSGVRSVIQREKGKGTDPSGPPA